MFEAMRQLFGTFLPASLRVYIRGWVQERQRAAKAPKMLWGYSDTIGGWQARTRISDTVSFYRRENIHIADNVFIGHFSILDGTNDLIIEEGVQLAGWNGLYTHSSHVAIRLYGDHYQAIPELQKTGYKTGKVSIGRYTFVGVGAKIFSGVSIGKGALIAANSVVKRNVEDFQIVSGNPAEVIGDTRKLDSKYLKDPQLRAWYEEWQKN
jgi:acetyltransferase-like isoleucine patch superfamily enzyme